MHRGGFGSVQLIGFLSDVESIRMTSKLLVIRRGSWTTTYSYLSATIGSTRIARRAGM